MLAAAAFERCIGQWSDRNAQRVAAQASVEVCDQILRRLQPHADPHDAIPTHSRMPAFCAGLN